jgi:phosphoribosylcarboxyaminoimidazole (NCAIR) mutase
VGDRITQFFIGSLSDLPHIAKTIRTTDKNEKIIGGLDYFGIPYGIRDLSAHKNTEQLRRALMALNDGYVHIRTPEGKDVEEKYEHIVIATIAGGSDGLSPISSFESSWPVIKIDPFKEPISYIDDIVALREPSAVSVTICRGAEQGALAIAKMFGLYDPELREKIQKYEKGYGSINLIADESIRGYGTDMLIEKGFLKKDWLIKS